MATSVDRDLTSELECRKIRLEVKEAIVATKFDKAVNRVRRAWWADQHDFVGFDVDEAYGNLYEAAMTEEIGTGRRARSKARAEAVLVKVMAG